MLLACISDTHNKHHSLTIPECDLLICSGDITNRGELSLVLDYAAWAHNTPAKHLVLVPGNHELGWEANPEKYKKEILKVCPRMNILIDQTVLIDGYKIHGSPATPWFNDWAWNRAKNDKPFMYRGATMTAPEIKPHWDLIPQDVDILITHGPPQGILDIVYRHDGLPRDGEKLGCPLLMNRIDQLDKLKLHVFGHIHSSSGEAYFNGTKFINASICDEQYSPTNPIRILEI